MTDLKELSVGQMVQLKCLAGRGMFPHESAVLIRGATQHYEAMIDSELVQVSGETSPDDERQASIHVRVVNTRDDGSMLVELPRQVITGGRRIWVPLSEIET